MTYELAHRDTTPQTAKRPTPSGMDRARIRTRESARGSTSQPLDLVGSPRRVAEPGSPNQGSTGRIRRQSLPVENADGASNDAIATSTVAPRARLRRAGNTGEVVIRRWATSSLEPTRKAALLEKVNGSSPLAKGMVLSELSARTKDVAQLEQLLGLMDADTLKGILQGVDPKLVADKNSETFGSWVVAALATGITPAVCLQVVQAAQDKVNKALVLLEIIRKHPQPTLVEIVTLAKTAQVVKELFAQLRKPEEVPILLDFLRTASVAAVSAALTARKPGEELAGLRAKLIETGASENSVTAGNGKVIKYYAVDNLPVSAQEIPYLKNALDVFDGKAGPTNTWRGQRNANHDNRKGELPGVINGGGYLEHDVESPLEGGAGTRRIVTDKNSKAVYYTNTHYASFYMIRKP